MAQTSNTQPVDPASSRNEAFADAEPPPPYEPVAQHGSQTVEANFARPYEVQDSGLFAQPQGVPPAAQPQRPSYTGSSSFSPPPGPPPGSTSYASHLQPPPQHPSVTGTSGSRPIPSPHVDGVSTFNRPALPYQQPAHVEQPPRPTRYAPSAHPMSGQPLLHKGKILIYPPGFYCPKCHNTGYKAYDPNNPHDKCWSKYGKAYTAAVWDGPNFTFANQCLQRPLPNSRYSASTAPPQPSPQPQYSHPGYFQAGQGGPPPPQMMSPAPPPPQPYQQPYQQPMMSPPHPPMMGQPYYNQPQMGSAPMPYVSGMSYGRPPPGALVVRPGDPRIGGRLCPNCGGDGLVECGFLLLDTETCRACNGTGRVFY